MANIMDLLSSFKHTIRVNDNISYPYMLYQFILFFASILGPGTVILMLAGAYNTVLGTDLLRSYLLAIEPIIFFVLVCFTTTPNSHVLVAQLFSAAYAAIMTVVIIGTVINLATEGIGNPTYLFLLGLVLVFIVAGLFHPQEIFCLLPGILYFLTFPSAYLLLPLYSLCNLNVVSWGTREKPQAKTKEEIEREKKEELEQKKKKQEKRGLLKWLGLSSVLQDLKEFYNTVLGRKVSSENDTIDVLSKRLDELEKNNQTTDPTVIHKRNELREILNRKRNNEIVNADNEQTRPKKVDNKPKEVNKLEEPRPDYWLEVDGVGNGVIEDLSEKETAFWRLLIRKHLHPIAKDKAKESAMEEALRSLRTNIVFGFLMLNFLWVLILFQMQLLSEVLKDSFFIPFPQADNPGMKVFLEPLGFSFLIIFAVILGLQLIGMVIHRWDTFCHVIARTEIRASEDTVAGKLKTAEKLLSLDITVDDELGLPPPDYDDEPEADYDDDNETKNIGSDNPSSDDSAFTREDSLSSQERNRFRGRHFDGSRYRDPGVPPLRDEMPSSYPYPARVPHTPDAYASDQPEYDKRAYYGPSDPRPDFTQRLTRRYTRPQQPVGQIRVGGMTLSRQFQRRYKQLASQIERTKPGRLEGQRKQPTTFDDIYRTVSEKYAANNHSRRRRPVQSQVYPRQYYKRGVIDYA